MKSKLSLVVVLVAIFLKQLAWVSFVPIWQTPDEQAHFAQVSVMAETGSTYVPPKNVSREIFRAEKELGVLRDTSGNNKYTYHPEFNITYTDSIIGLKEKELLSTIKEERSEFVLNEATDYPTLYYQISGFLYNSAKDGSIFDRVFSARMINLLNIVILTVVAYRIGVLIFTDEIGPLALSLLVGFAPMLSFVHSGVTSDGLFNLLFGLFIWRCLSLIENGLNFRELIFLTLIILLSFWTKPQANIMVFILMPLLAALFLVQKRGGLKMLFPAGLLLGVGLLGIVHRLRTGTSLFPETDRLKVLNISPGTIIEHLTFTLYHTYREVLPWYWGVFRWLSLGLPEILRKTTNLLTVLSIAGFSYSLFKAVGKRDFNRRFWMIVFLAFSALVYFGAITAFDFGFRQAHGYSYGIQGRYFFPVIVPLMAVFLIGLRSLAPGKYGGAIVKGLAISMVIFNVVTFFWLTKSYYQFSFPAFFIQASQYKPVWLKFPINLIIFMTYITSIIFILLKLLRIGRINFRRD